MEDKKNGAPGFSGLETAFSVCYKTLVQENRFTLKQLSALMSYNACEILGLSDRGLLAEGYFADITVIDLEKKWTVIGEEFASKGKFTPLEGKQLPAEVKATFFHGEMVFQA